MTQAAWRAGVVRGTGVACVAALALCLVAGWRPVAAQDGAESCAPPQPWREADAKPGRPKEEFAACLRDQAYETRNLAVPVDSTAAGIIAQCHVRVDFFEGRTLIENAGSDEARRAAELNAERQATAAIVQYRRCVGR